MKSFRRIQNRFQGETGFSNFIRFAAIILTVGLFWCSEMQVSAETYHAADPDPRLSASMRSAAAARAGADARIGVDARVGADVQVGVDARVGVDALDFAAMPQAALAPSQGFSRFSHQDGDIIVVIDPGHGGDNEGTKENGFCEKEMTLTTALALYDRLSQYDGVTVYLTRIDDTKSSLAQRAEFARSVDADFLFSIHYNASENHELFGSEVWVPLTAPYNAYGYQFGCTLLTRFQEKGLFIRGIKTRINDRGTDYYGILRESVALGVPAILIEHCHVDEVRDYPYCDSTEKQQEFGYEDAEAIARFLGLSSETLGIDYSGGPEDPFLRDVYALDTDKVVASTLQDTTAPEICEIEKISEDHEELKAVIQVAAADYDSPLMYYAYSLDGGLTYSPRQPWPGSNTLTGEYQDVFQVALDIPEGTMPRICIKAYNQFEITAESNALEGYTVFRRPSEEVPESVETVGTVAGGDVSPGETTVLPGETDTSSGESGQASAGGWLGSTGEPEPESVTSVVTIQNFLLVSLLAAAALVALMMTIQIFRSAGRHRRRHRRK